MEAKRPTVLVVVVVILIVLGALGVVGGCLGTFAVAFQSAMTGMSDELLRNTPGGAEQLRAQQELQAIQAPFMVPQLIGQLLNLVGSVVLIVGAALLAGLKKSAQNVLIGAAGICILADFIVAALGLYIGYLSQGAAAAMAQANPQTEQMMGAIMNATMVLTVVWTIFWLLMKMGIYGFGVHASRRPEVVQVLS